MRAIPFTRREREIMDILYRKGQASVAEVLAEMADPPSYSAVRATLRILEEKGHVEHLLDGTRYLYRPAVEATRAGRDALEHVVQTFFDGSPERVLATLIQDHGRRIPDAELARLKRLIAEARKEGR